MSESEGIYNKSLMAEAIADAVDSAANNLRVINSYDLPDKARDSIRKGSAIARVKDKMGVSQGHAIEFTKEDVVQGLAEYLDRRMTHGVNPETRKENVELVYEPLVRSTDQGRHETPEQIDADLQAILNGGVVNSGEKGFSDITHEQISSRDRFRDALKAWRNANEQLVDSSDKDSSR